MRSDRTLPAAVGTKQSHGDQNRSGSEPIKGHGLGS
jgi:hypothetical protein